MVLPQQQQETSNDEERTYEEQLEYASSCYFPTSWQDSRLLGKKQYSHDSYVFTFELPQGRSLDLPVCACLLVRGVTTTGEEAVRPYTPISTNAMMGHFELLVKVYEEGVVSRYLSSMAIGDQALFKHIKFNIKQQYPFAAKKVAMICGGTGITPMYQALHKLIDTPGDATEVVLLYGNRSPADILLKEELDAMVDRAGGRLRVVYVVGGSPDQAPIEGWDGQLGWVDEAKISTYCFAPAQDMNVFVCGLPSMYASLCGPRDEKEVQEGTVLASLGYTSDMVVKF